MRTLVPTTNNPFEAVRVCSVSDAEREHYALCIRGSHKTLWQHMSMEVQSNWMATSLTTWNSGDTETDSTSRSSGRSLPPLSGGAPCG
mmetsp:Transcript_5527/g.13557  ORF Transcript_5527/g.13557 Transcript_5527/m.13557 type:complete len:88 (+) Transcript_5527:338-601(+)